MESRLGDKVELGNTVTDLLSDSKLFVYKFSVLSEPNLIIANILATFPSDPRELSSSFVPELLDELSAFFFSLPADIFHANTSRTVGQYRRYVTDVWPVLSIVSSICLQGVSIHQTSTKMRVSLSTCDMATLRNFGVKIPSDPREAEEIINGIIELLRQILNFYLELLPNPRFRSYCETRLRNGDPEHEMEAFTEGKYVSAPSAQLQDHQLQAALHIHDVDGFGEWQVVISSRATKYLRELRRRDGKMIVCVLKKIRQLSRGEFSGNNYKRLRGPSHGVPIYEAEILSDLRLVYQIDCIPDDGGQNDRVWVYDNGHLCTQHLEVVKVYGIFTHEQLERMWESLSGQLARRGKIYCDRCTFRERARPGTDVYSPASFPPSKEDHDTHLSPIACCDISEAQSDLVLDKYIKLSKLYSAKEWEIVRCATSCFVIGRSGTGKTTSMLFKMLAIQRAWEKAPETPKPRQLFVTKSPILAAKVEECFTNLVDSLALAGYSQDELRNLRFRNYDKEQRRMTDPLDAVDYRPEFPHKYSELGDHDFPLFITFDQLARMIATDLQKDLPNLDANDPAVYTLPKVIDDEDSLVTYNVFKSAYWPRFPQRMTKRLGAPSLAFSELMGECKLHDPCLILLKRISGVIKGSEMAFHLNGFLDKETYTKLSSRAYPVFAHQRDELYSLFNLYRKLKHECGHYDPADRAYMIVKTLLGSSLRGGPVDYLYVDEAQDNLIIDALLLRILCRKPDGLFWAGDTAQTISAGCSFRFADLKAFIHRIEADARMPIEKPRSKPATFQLAVNYRSHNGIINCAHAVVELITMFWPYTIDTLQSEHGLISGSEPVFFTGWDDQIFPFKQLFSGFKEKHGELGAHQCLLVRDDAARTRFKEEVGVKGVILTLQECKGLEFDDVFLYEFFKDSIANHSQWRLILQACGDRALPVNSPVECEGRYAILCTELKNLYVGITRAKKNLYILDSSEKSNPMRVYLFFECPTVYVNVMQVFWNKRGFINIRDAPSSRTNIFQGFMESTPEQWAESGHKLFNYIKKLTRGQARIYPRIPHQI
ncbi:hypothetical protein SCLCIDRAFT_33253 [Scleroderma citrinum Foug A]|uniref:UvrD-like helicase ATP-binding domain-containing protein n=1 Tax=Scleroderma citrinum Foug A TaxID=1036808 RepID=A0A0C3D5J0_9AGAM|nr:hypothetical protein SCLCIDRAFT_33253 [Scleroderma citrinum Foug A]